MAGIEVAALQFDRKSYKHNQISSRRGNKQHRSEVPARIRQVKGKIVRLTLDILQELPREVRQIFKIDRAHRSNAKQI